MDTKPRILVVDDDLEFRQALGKTLVDAGFDVIFAKSGNEAKSGGQLQGASLVITDLKMEDGDGIDLIRHVRGEYKIPVLLMTGFADAPEAQHATQVGAAGLIPKPIRAAELVALVRGSLEKHEQSVLPDSQATEPVQDEKYCKIKIDDFVSGSKIKYDIFVKLSDEKYVLLAHNGEDLSPERIATFKQKDVAYLYLRRADFLAYIGMNVSMWGAVKKSAISSQRKAGLLKHTFEVIFEHARTDKLDREAFKGSCAMVKEVTEFLAQNDSTFLLLEKLRESSDALYAHSMAVAIYSLMLAAKLDWHSPQTMYKLGIGAIFHDLGKKEFDPALLKKTKQEMTAEEIRSLESHPQRGVELLKGLAWLPDDVVAVVAQHETVIRGHPNSPESKRIHPLARAAYIANVFCNLALPTTSTLALQPGEALAVMDKKDEYHFDEEMYQVFRGLFDSSVQKAA